MHLHRSTMESKLMYCPHCKQEVMRSTYYRHRRSNFKDGKWTTTADLASIDMALKAKIVDIRKRANAASMSEIIVTEEESRQQQASFLGEIQNLTPVSRASSTWKQALEEDVTEWYKVSK